MSTPWKHMGEVFPEEYKPYLVWFPNGLQAVAFFNKSVNTWMIANDWTKSKGSQDTWFMEIPDLPSKNV